MTLVLPDLPKSKEKYIKFIDCPVQFTPMSRREFFTKVIPIKVKLDQQFNTEEFLDCKECYQSKLVNESTRYMKYILYRRIVDTYEQALLETPREAQEGILTKRYDYLKLYETIETCCQRMKILETL